MKKPPPLTPSDRTRNWRKRNPEYARTYMANYRAQNPEYYAQELAKQREAYARKKKSLKRH